MEVKFEYWQESTKPWIQELVKGRHLIEKNKQKKTTVLYAYKTRLVEGQDDN